MGSRVDSAEVQIPYKSDDKNTTVKKSRVHENSAMVCNQMRLIKRKTSTLFNQMTLFKQNLIAYEHFYRPHQTSTQIGKNPMYSNTDSCAQSIVKRQPECSTRGLNTKSCPAKNCIHSQRKDNSLQTESKGKLNSSGELQRQQQSSSVQTDQGCWHTCLETVSKLYTRAEREKAKKRKHSEAFGLDKITTPKRYSFPK